MMLESDPGIKVVGTARDGEEGVEMVRKLQPDLVTMDIYMPRMDGLAALNQIMKTNPVPVMMISSLTTEGASATLDALELGAVDFIPKQLSYVSLDIVKIKEELLAKIKDIARRKRVLMARHRQSVFRPPTLRFLETSQLAGSSVGYRKRKHSVPLGLVAIGSSTGGPPALQHVIARLPSNLPVAVVIAQHMPEAFTKSLAARLDRRSALSGKEAADGDPLTPGMVYIAPGGMNLTVKRHLTRAHVSVSVLPTETLYKPCIDVLMNSVADQFGAESMGVMLTGMGNNGLGGIRQIKTKGGLVIAQNEESCVVYGMPKAVIEARLADHIVAIEDVASEIVSYF